MVFIGECVVAYLTGASRLPDTLLVTMIFFYLFWGWRYGLGCALWAGVLKDAFSVGPFGLHTLAFVGSAFLLKVLTPRLYRKGSWLLRLILVGVVALGHVVIQGLLMTLVFPVAWTEVFSFGLISEVGWTTLIAGVVFYYLRQCVLKFSGFLL